MQDFFSERLKLILGPRRITPWAASIGLGNGVLVTIQTKKIPKGDSLAMIAVAEGCSVSWLITGNGPRYIVNIDNSETTKKRLESLGPDDRIDVLVHGNRFLLLHHYIDEGTGLATVVITQAHLNNNHLSTLKALSSTDFYQLTDEQFDKVWYGQLGRFDLYGEGKHPGILGKPIPSDTITTKESKTSVIDHKALSAVILVIDRIIEDNRLAIKSEQKSKFIASGYNHLKRLEIPPEKLAKNDLAILFDEII